MNESEPHGAACGLSRAKPPAPAWFERAIAIEPERTFVEVEGAEVETLAWGERGKPGLVFLHGGAAHADWWSLHRAVLRPRASRRRADIHRHGPFRTGASAYDFDQFVREAREAGAGGGASRPARRSSSATRSAGAIAMGLARDFGDELAAAVMVDPPFFAPQNQRSPSPPRVRRGSARIQPSLEAIVARFRLAPPQACDNLFILDYIARRSAREAVDAEGKGGLVAELRPAFLGEVHPDRSRFRSSRPPAAPLALIRGAKSQLFHPEDAAYLMSLIAPGSPYVEIPEAEHHVMIDQPLAFVAALQGAARGVAAATRRMIHAVG